MSWHHLELYKTESEVSWLIYSLTDGSDWFWFAKMTMSLRTCNENDDREGTMENTPVPWTPIYLSCSIFKNLWRRKNFCDKPKVNEYISFNLNKDEVTWFSFFFGFTTWQNHPSGSISASFKSFAKFKWYISSKTFCVKSPVRPITFLIESKIRTWDMFSATVQ